MKDCVTVQTESSTLPPNKRVNYAYGMVMDVDAFRQEQVHFEWKHALGNRLLHGYGTVCGLRVHAEPDGPDVKILVEPGYALNPRGQWIWAEEQLCARLNAWVQNNRDNHPAFLAPGPNRVFVTLCYEECPTDLVPIAGRACATEEDTRAPSRILETLRAEFAWERPAQLAEEAARAFGQILGAVVLTADPLEDEREFFLGLVASLGEETSPPFTLPLASPGDSPPGDGQIRLSQETACATIQQALVIWATEVCPRLDRSEEECILLACVKFDVDAGGRVLPPTVVISDCDRPVLVPTRLLQELFCLPGRGGGGVTIHGDLEGLAADDHPQYLTEARGDARYAPLGHTHPLDELSDVNTPAPGNGQVLTWNAGAGEWQARNQLPAPHLHDLDDLGDVNAPAPAGGEVLTWNAAANAWQPDQVVVEAGEGELTRIVALSWFHALPNVISVIHDGNPVTGLAIAFAKKELDDGGMVRADTLNEHVFQVYGERLFSGGLAAPVRFIPREIVPVKVVVSGGRIVETGTSGDPEVPGVLFIFDPASFDNELLNTLRVIVHGDFILDETGERAIDAEHLRSRLPTGDRPDGAERGIQGGRFESWLNQPRGIKDFININTAPVEVLRQLPSIGLARAQAIVANRPYNNVSELANVAGISREYVLGIRGLVTVR